MLKFEDEIIKSEICDRLRLKRERGALDAAARLCVCVHVCLSASADNCEHTLGVCAGAHAFTCTRLCCWLNFEHAYESVLFISAFSHSRVLM